MNIIETKFKGVFLLEPKVHGDHRGFFVETFNLNTYNKLGLKFDFVQDNHSLSADPGTLRGLHFQKDPKAQTKVVRCSRGALLDVFVDLRKGSPTYKQWGSEILTADNHRQIVVPKGFAHGFITLMPNTEAQYKVDDFYSPENDRGIRWNDPEIGIRWPFANPILSEKDKNAPLFADSDHNFEFKG